MNAQNHSHLETAHVLTLWRAQEMGLYSMPFNAPVAGLQNIYGVPKPSYRAFQLLHWTGNTLLDVRIPSDDSYVRNLLMRTVRCRPHTTRIPPLAPSLSVATTLRSLSSIGTYAVCVPSRRLTRCTGDESHDCRGDDFTHRHWLGECEQSEGSCVPHRLGQLECYAVRRAF